MKADASIFSRAAETYCEHPDLLKWVKADPCGPLGRMLELIDRGTVLDVGCGAGILGRLLKEDRPNVIADGLDPAIAPETPGVRHYRRYDQCVIEDVITTPRVKEYDWFVFADVIEHLPYPDLVLKKLVAAAALHAKFLISTPNICHISTRLGLLNGEYEYSNSGILESTHLRLLNAKTLGAVLAASGLRIERLLCLDRPHYPDALDRMPTLRALAGLYAVNPDAYPNTYQFLAVCSAGSGPIGAVEAIGDASIAGFRREFLKRRFGKGPLGRLVSR